MDITESQLAGALKGFRVRVGSPVGMGTVSAEIASADETAKALFATLTRIAAQREPDRNTSNQDDALEALRASAWQQQQWGASGNRDELRSAQLEAERAKASALLDVADAIREQTARIEVLVTEADHG